jgi:DNA polymerase I-like protein with 3'-5' exonuclease and polymerase domains
MNVINQENKEVLFNYVQAKEVLPYDVESSGLSPLNDITLCWMTGEEGNEFFVPANLDLPKNLLDNKELITSNGKFDFVMSQTHERKVNNQLFNFENTSFYDVQLVNQILFNGLNYEHNLAMTTNQWLGVYMPKDVRLTFIGQRHFDFTEAQMIYGVGDIKYLPKIRTLQEIEVVKDKLQYIVELEHELLPILGLMELEGVKIDKAKLFELEIEFKADLARCIRELDYELLKLSFESFPELAHTKYTRKRADYQPGEQGKLFDFGNVTKKELAKIKDIQKSKNKPNINYNSTQALPKLFESLGLECPINPKTGKDSFGEDAINEYLTENSDSPFYAFLTKLLEMREFQGYISKYGKNSDFVKSIFQDFIHTTYSQCFTDTGRLSSSNPNLQNIPYKNKGLKLRSAFVAEEGWSFITCDMAGQEARIAGDLSGEPMLINNFVNNQDIHSELATAVFSLLFQQEVIINGTNEEFEVECVWQKEIKELYSKDYEVAIYKYKKKALRTDNKNALYGSFYGAGRNRMYAIYSKYINQHYRGQDRLDIAQKISYLIKEKMPTLNDYLQSRVRLVKKDGYIVTSKLGRRRYWEDPDKAYGEIMNAPIQGTGAEAMKLAIVNIHHWCIKTATQLGINYREFAYPVMNIHDEIVVKMRDEYLEQYAPNVERLVTEALGYFLTKIPAESESKISKVWEK